MELERLRLVFYALSDRVRLKILRLLLEHGELCVCQLQQVFGISQPNLSFHLRVLRDAELVKTRKEGKWVHYSPNYDNPVLKVNLPLIEGADVSQESAGTLSCDVKNKLT